MCYVSYRSHTGGVLTEGTSENVRRNGSKSGCDSCGDLAACMRPSSISSYSARSVGGHRNSPGVCVPPQPTLWGGRFKETRCRFEEIRYRFKETQYFAVGREVGLSVSLPSPPSQHSTDINKAGPQRNECNQRKEKRTRFKEKGATWPKP